MESQPSELPSEESTHRLLKKVAPGSTLSAIQPIADDHYNAAWFIEAQTVGGAPLRMVIKCYAECGSDLTVKAQREYTSLTWLQSRGVPAPHPLYLDEEGIFWGAPAIVTSFVSGKQLWQPADHPIDPERWVQEMATVLAQIHAIPCDPSARAFLRDADPHKLWFLGHDSMPEQMNNHPAGETVWRTVCKQLPNLQAVDQGLIHIDYWRGNLLWEEGRITAVIDWEEASYGDPAQDVAYCRMDLWLAGLEEEADTFLRLYEAERGQPTANLGFWELVAAARPIWRPAGWFTDPREHDRFQRFVANAIQRATNARPMQ